MGCRKNQATLTPAEKAAFVNALLQLKTAVPSRLHPTDPAMHRYDDYVETHMNAMMRMDGTTRVPGWAHRAPAFFPWHREFLVQLERDLQAIDPTVTLPYWDWTVDQSPDDVPGSPWSDDFMGKRTPGNELVSSGPFRAGVWVKRVFEPGDSDPDLRRALGDTSLSAGSSTLPTANEVDQALGETPYDTAPWDAGVSPSFRDVAEGWHGAGSIHNRVHLWVGGSMLPSTSPNDPIFFLHHANVDRMWSRWQRRNPGQGYHPTGVGAEVGPPGHNLNDTMIFNDPGQPAPWSTTSTPASVLNSHLPPLDYWYDDDPPEVDLLTPSISFTDIPEGLGGTGVTTYRAVVFDVLSCAGVTLRVTAGPTAPFTTPMGTVTNVPPAHQAPPAAGRVWIAYTSTTAGSSAAGSVTIHCDETNQDWTVGITANTVARPKSAAVLVLDHSGSMVEDAGDGHPKVEKLKQAVSAFTSVMLPGDGLGMVRFDDTAQRLFDVTDVGPVSPVTPGSGRDLAAQAVAGTQLDPAGNTSIGGGVQEGRNALDAAVPTPPYSVKAMLVVTDGMENTPPMIADVQGSISASTYAIGLGTPANISVAALQALTQGHNGYLVVTGAITQDQTFRLTKYFLQALAGISNAQVVVDPQGELMVGSEHRIPFTVVAPDMGIDVILLCPAVRLVDFALITPGGDLVTPALVGVEPAVQYHVQSGLSFYRVSIPALVGAPQASSAGRWYARLRLAGQGGNVDVNPAVVASTRGLPYNLLVHAYSTLQFAAWLYQADYEPGAVVAVHAALTEYGVPVEHRALVWADITTPVGTSWSLPLDEGDGGQFSGMFTADLAGLYVVRVRASGSTFSGSTFERERTLSATAVVGGNRVQPGGDGGRGDRERWCRFLECLVEHGTVNRRLEELGVDAREVLRCLEKTVCAPTREVEESAPSRAWLPTVPRPDVLQPAAHLLAHQPEPEPRPTWPAGKGDGMPMKPGTTMFALSPEDRAVEAQRSRTAEAAAQRTSGSAKRTSPAAPAKARSRGGARRRS